MAGLGETAQAGIHPDGGLRTGALAHLLQRRADEVGREIPVRLLRRHGEQQELPHAGGHVFLELREQRGERVPRIAGQTAERLFLRETFRQKQRLDQLALAKADLGHHVPERRGRA